MVAAIPAAMVAATARQNLKKICRDFAASRQFRGKLPRQTPIPVVVYSI
jgi:hypothetical protein